LKKLNAKTMGSAHERIKNIAASEISQWRDEANNRKINSDWRDYSFRIAMRILREIRNQNAQHGMTQKRLAHLMGVSPQYINKVVKGEENLTLETISKIEKVLNISLIEISTSGSEYIIKAAQS